jgi:UDP-3-O-[3-hydroxymyristoyl] glucosamine N-acyltransferase
MERKKITGKVKLSEVASAIGGRLEGEDIDINGLRPLNTAENGCVSFLFDKKLVEAALKGAASAFVIPEGYSLNAGRPIIYVKEPRAALASAIEFFYPVVTKASGIDKRANVAESALVAKTARIEAGATISEGAEIGEGTVVYSNAYIGTGVKVGKNCIIYPNASIYYGCQIGDGVILHSGCVIGSDGFGFYQDKGVSIKIPQVGGVILGNNVEVGANACIDRGALGDTIIGEGTKIDNQVQIGHNANIGKHCIFVGQTGIAGSATMGDYVVFGARSGCKDHVTIASQVMIAALSSVDKDIEEAGVYGGYPIRPMREWMRNNSALLSISDMKKQLNDIARRLDAGSEKSS